MYVHVYVYMYVCMYVCMYVYMYVYMYICMFVHVYATMYMCMYTPLFIFFIISFSQSFSISFTKMNHIYIGLIHSFHCPSPWIYPQRNSTIYTSHRDSNIKDVIKDIVVYINKLACHQVEQNLPDHDEHIVLLCEEFVQVACPL